MKELKKMYFSTQAQLQNFTQNITLDPNSAGYRITLEEFNSADELKIEKQRLADHLKQLQVDKRAEIQKTKDILNELNTNLP